MTIELAFAESERSGEFEVSEAGGLLGAAYRAQIARDQPGLLGTRSASQREILLLAAVPAAGIWPAGKRDVAGSAATLTGEYLRQRWPEGSTDLHVPDSLIEKEHPLAPRLWTWAWPGTHNLEGVDLAAGNHTLTLENLSVEIRYDVLVITDEPSFRPGDGRLRQR